MNTFKFGGLIKYEWDEYSKIFLVQEDETKIDLIKKFEAIDNVTDFKGLQVNYYISDSLLTESELLERHILTISGGVNASYTSESYHYSSWTNGTDYYSTLEVGGHNLFHEISSHEGKYVFFIINTGS